MKHDPTPRFPLYIPSKGRAEIALTPAALDSMGVDYKIIVERPEVDAYAARFGEHRILELPTEFQDSFEPLDGKGRDLPLGSGPARNFAWQHSIDAGHRWHWIMDDNINLFAYLRADRKRVPAGDGLFFAAIEDWADRYENLGEIGPRYWMFAMSRHPMPKPYVLNTRVFSCNLIRNDVPVRWRGRWNEDLDLAYQMLSAGYCTAELCTFLQYKTTTQKMPGGNTEAYKASGTLVKSQLAVKTWPEHVRLAKRYGRWHHHASFAAFADMSLIRRADAKPLDPEKYRTKTVPRSRPSARGARHGG